VGFMVGWILLKSFWLHFNTNGLLRKLVAKKHHPAKAHLRKNQRAAKAQRGAKASQKSIRTLQEPIGAISLQSIA